jgi:hypothetical protein
VKFVLREWWLFQITQPVVHVLMILKTVLTFNAMNANLISLMLKMVNAVVFVKKL